MQRLLGFASQMLGEPAVLTPSGRLSSRQYHPLLTIITVLIQLFKVKSAQQHYKVDIRRDWIALFRATTLSTLKEIQDISDLVSAVNPKQLQMKREHFQILRWGEVTGRGRRRCCTEFSTLLQTQSVARRSANFVWQTSAPPFRVSSRSRGTPETTGWQSILTECLHQDQVNLLKVLKNPHTFSSLWFWRIPGCIFFL